MGRLRSRCEEHEAGVHPLMIKHRRQQIPPGEEKEAVDQQRFPAISRNEYPLGGTSKTMNSGTCQIHHITATTVDPRTPCPRAANRSKMYPRQPGSSPRGLPIIPIGNEKGLTRRRPHPSSVRGPFRKMRISPPGESTPCTTAVVTAIVTGAILKQGAKSSGGGRSVRNVRSTSSGAP